MKSNKYQVGDLIYFESKNVKYFGLIIMSSVRYEIFWLHLKQCISASIHVIDVNDGLSLAFDD